VAAAQNSRIGTGGSAHRTAGRSRFVDHGHHAAWAIHAFRAAGGYDERFSHNEDAELDARLAAAGGRIWLAADIPIVYFPRRAPGPLFRQYYGYGRGRARNLRRHRMPMKLRQVLPLAVAPAVLAALAGPAWPPALAPAASWAALCLVLGFRLCIRTRDACVAMSGPAAMIMHLGWSAGFWREMIAARPPGPFSAPKWK
jgi:succinoglycan biosynthesis protein ExoA